MHAALHSLNERLNAIFGSNPETFNTDPEEMLPPEAWTIVDNVRMSDFNTRITTNDVQLGELIKWNDHMMQICRVTEDENELTVFDCRRFEPHHALVRIAPTTQTIYRSTPPTIRIYLPCGPGEAMETFAGSRSYRPRQHRT